MIDKSSQKIGIVIVQRQSEWKSCVSISANLIRAYDQLRQKGADIEWFRVCPESEARALRLGSGYLLDVADKIIRSGITDLVFLDHHVNAFFILQAMRILNPRRFDSLRYTFHIYGDFTLNTELWFNIGQQLAGRKVKYICASDRQRRLISFFESKGHSVSELCPFPVAEKDFRFSERFRKEYRRKLGFSERDTMLLYTGRLSLQKGIPLLFEQFHRLNRKNAYLVLAGPFDNLGGMTSGIRLQKGFFFHHMQEHLRKLPSALRERIRFAGDLEERDLRKIYSAADLFVSLSLHHDEDFGMCPAEALASGLPSILTDWAGYASFEKPGVPCQLVPVTLGKRGLTVDMEDAFRKIEKSFQKRLTVSERLRNGTAFAKYFGITSVAKVLENHLKPGNFRSAAEFNWTLDTVRKCYGKMTGQLYEDVYAQYVRPSSH